MKLEEISELWQQDSQIDLADLSNSARNIPILHAKYYEAYVKQRLLLHKYKGQYKKLRLDKYEFYINPNEEGFEKGWKIPEQGRLLKNEVSTYMEGDPDLVEMELKIGMQEEKVGYLKSIIDSLNSRNFIIRNIIEDRKFMNGG